MPRKPKFKPVITRVKLNPEQAVLVCTCSGTNDGYWGVFKRGSGPDATYCASTDVRSDPQIRAVGTCDTGPANVFPYTSGGPSS